MKYLFKNLNDACFGITYNINEELSIVWLNPNQILKLSNPTHVNKLLVYPL